MGVLEEIEQEAKVSSQLLSDMEDKLAEIAQNLVDIESAVERVEDSIREQLGEVCDRLDRLIELGMEGEGEKKLARRDRIDRER